MKLIQELKKYPLALTEFVEYLNKTKDKDKINRFLKADSILMLGTIYTFLNDTYGINIVASVKSVYLLVDSRGESRFSYIVHGGINYMAVVVINQADVKSLGKMEIGMVEAFKQINEMRKALK